MKERTKQQNDAAEEHQDPYEIIREHYMIARSITEYEYRRQIEWLQRRVASGALDGFQRRLAEKLNLILSSESGNQQIHP